MPLFPTTRSSVVLALASDDAAVRALAFDALVAIYWKPLYKYARVTHRCDTQDAEDATQSFLAAAFEKSAFANYDAGRAGFRTFLRLLFDRHIANEAKAASRLKRGGDLDFVSAENELAREHDRGGTAEDYFQREWVRSVFSLAVERLRASSAPEDFVLFNTYDIDDEKLSYRELGARLGMSESTVTNRLAAQRRRFREIVLSVLREATASEREFRSEVRAILGVDA